MPLKVEYSCLGQFNETLFFLAAEWLNSSLVFGSRHLMGGSDFQMDNGKATWTAQHGVVKVKHQLTLFRVLSCQSVMLISFCFLTAVDPLLGARFQANTKGPFAMRGVAPVDFNFFVGCSANPPQKVRSFLQGGQQQQRYPEFSPGNASTLGMLLWPGPRTQKSYASGSQ